MNHSFQQYVSSQAFVLTLSRPMIDLLDLLSTQRLDDRPALERLNAYYALSRRGLVENRGGPQGRREYLTEEGKLVLQLCKMANLVTLRKLRKAA